MKAESIDRLFVKFNLGLHQLEDQHSVLRNLNCILLNLQELSPVPRIGDIFPAYRQIPTVAV